MIMNALNSIAYERAELLRDVVYIENDITDNYDDDELFTEAASKFSILPKFKKLVDRYPELKEYEKLVVEVNNLAVQSGNSDKITPMTARKIGTVLLKVWRALTSISGVLTLPFCILLFPIMNYLINRLMVWGMESGELAIAESAILRSIQNATAIREATKDPAVKKKCDKLLKELNTKYQQLQVPEELRKTSKKSKAVKESVRNDKTPNDYGEFITSCIEELENLPSHMATLTFLVHMKLFDYFELREAIHSEKKLNDSYNFEQRKGKGYLTLSKDTMCGLFDVWSGGGSLLEIKLDHKVELPIKCIWKAEIETGKSEYGYSVDNVYGLVRSAWDGEVEVTHYMKPEQIKKIEKER